MLQQRADMKCRISRIKTRICLGSRPQFVHKELAEKHRALKFKRKKKSHTYRRENHTYPCQGLLTNADKNTLHRKCSASQHLWPEVCTASLTITKTPTKESREHPIWPFWPKIKFNDSLLTQGLSELKVTTRIIYTPLAFEAFCL